MKDQAKKKRKETPAKQEEKIEVTNAASAWESMGKERRKWWADWEKKCEEEQKE